jgi:hypothetical protein
MIFLFLYVAASLMYMFILGIMRASAPRHVETSNPEWDQETYSWVAWSGFFLWPVAIVAIVLYKIFYGIGPWYLARKEKAVAAKELNQKRLEDARRDAAAALLTSDYRSVEMK